MTSLLVSKKIKLLLIQLRLDRSLPIPRNASLSMGVGPKNTLLSMGDGHKNTLLNVGV